MFRKMLFIFLMIAVCGLPFVSAAKYDDMVTRMQQLANANPMYIQMMDIGTNSQGNTIYGMKFENPNVVAAAGTKPSHLYVGTHHGNEGKTADVAITFSEQLLDALKNSGSPYHTQLSKCVFYVIPVLNITGYNANYRSEKTASGSWTDANRDYPDVCVSSTTFKLESTKRLAEFLERYNIIGCVTGHGYIGTFTYPWGIYTDNTKTLDDSFFNYMAKESVKANGYRVGTHTDIIYPASGAFEDWAYAEHGIWTTLLEMSSYADLQKDAKMLIIYFSLIPQARSNQHQHMGHCTQTRGDDTASRP